MKYVATVEIEVENQENGHLVDDDIDLNDLRDYLSEAVTIDLDTESRGNIGIQAIEINWDSLTPN